MDVHECFMTWLLCSLVQCCGFHGVIFFLFFFGSSSSSGHCVTRRTVDCSGGSLLSPQTWSTSVKENPTFAFILSNWLLFLFFPLLFFLPYFLPHSFVVCFHANCSEGRAKAEKGSQVVVRRTAEPNSACYILFSSLCVCVGKWFPSSEDLSLVSQTGKVGGVFFFVKLTPKKIGENSREEKKNSQPFIAD
uniref:Uncharacterized protein TCIL3000_11_2560 n=1 Tax=Trypanosoma congolense (strain IL3000) TaxID=1068625 RepID=G0UZP5_TRYCI|nr:unnamed protein product [Trypanosoma congolense IL3000]